MESKSVSGLNLTREACSVALLACKEGARQPAAGSGRAAGAAAPGRGRSRAGAAAERRAEGARPWNRSAERRAGGGDGRRRRATAAGGAAWATGGGGSHESREASKLRSEKASPERL